MCINGKEAAQITAKIVMASAARLIDIRHFCRNSKRIAEISVPACPIPTHQTKLVISQAQPTVLFNPHRPIPCHKSMHMQYTPKASNESETAMAMYHSFAGFLSICMLISYETSFAVLPPVTSGSRTEEVTCIFSVTLSLL